MSNVNKDKWENRQKKILKHLDAGRFDKANDEFCKYLDRHDMKGNTKVLASYMEFEYIRYSSIEALS